MFATTGDHPKVFISYSHDSRPTLRLNRRGVSPQPAPPFFPVSNKRPAGTKVPIDRYSMH
jgi:hypothetical protein